MRDLIAAQGASGRELAQAAATGQAAEAQGARNTLIGVVEDDLNRQVNLAGQEATRQAEIAKQRNQMTGSLLSSAGQIGASWGKSAYDDYQKNKLTQEAAQIEAARSQAPAFQQMMQMDEAQSGQGWGIRSDENSKENKAPADKKIKSFLDALQAKEYNYKPETGLDTKKKYGIMAQDLEKSEIGKSMVNEVGGVKHVDMDRGFSAILAAQAELNSRLNKLEGSGGSDGK
jgi:hypothetical protein